MKLVKSITDLRRVFGEYIWEDHVDEIRALLSGKLDPDVLELSYCDCGAKSLEECQCETTYDCWASREEKILHHLVLYCDSFMASLETLSGKTILYAHRDDYGAKTLALVDKQFVIASPFELERLD